MPVLVKPTKIKLEWTDFEESGASLQDHDAEAGYDSEFVPANFTPRKIRKRAHLPATYTIRVWPMLQVAPGANTSDELLAHEQLHYDVGIVCAKALARELDGLNAVDPAELLTLVNDLHELHMFTRADAIQKAYDVQTEHGKKAEMQKQWQDAMAQCLAKRSITRIMGLPL